MNKSHNTLFLLTSLDGKISTGSSPSRDVDTDYNQISGIKEGLSQYYDIEKQTDLFSLNTGKTMAKIGVNKECPIKNPYVTFIIIDNSNLTSKGVQDLASNIKKLILVTKNPNHPAFKVEHKNLTIIQYKEEIDFTDLFVKLKKDHNAARVTIQSGGTLNAVLLREKLIDELSIVIVPALVGGKDTPTLVDGRSLVSKEDLKYIKAIELIEVKVLEHSYLHLRYRVINETVVG